MNATPESPEARDVSGGRIIAEILKRSDRGEQIDREAILDEYPDFAEEIRSFFETEKLVERMAGPPIVSDAESIQSIDTARAPAADETVPPRRSNDHRQSEASTEEDLTGKSFGRYHIERTLGQGAMGVVYLAHDGDLDRKVALKIPRFSEADAPDIIERFYREARSAAALQHRNICPLFDIGEVDGVRYITMAYIDGRPLADFIDSEKPQPARHIALTVLKLARAMEEAHRQGVIHRDLKPANILIDNQREPVIMDFGLARQVNKQDDVRITQSGTVIGSPAYMSPEQVEGDLDAIGPPADIYGLGVILYELLAGQLPFQGSMAAVIGQIITVEPKDPSEVRSNVDPRLEAICLTMIAKRIDDRLVSMQAVAEALAGYVNPSKADAVETIEKSDEVIPEAEPIESIPIADIDHGRKRGQQDDLSPKTNRLAELKPGHLKDPTLQADPAGEKRDAPKSVGRRLEPMGIFRIPHWVPWTVASIFAAAVVFGVVTFILQTEHGLVTVEIHDPSITAHIDGGTINFNTAGKPIKVETGEKTLRVERDGLESKTHDFLLKKNDRIALHVWMDDDDIRVSKTAPPTTPSPPEMLKPPARPAGRLRLKQAGEFNAGISPVRFSGDQRNIAGIIWDDDVRMAVFELASARLVRRADQGWGSVEDGGYPTALVVSPDHVLVAGASSRGRLLLWDQQTGELRHKLVGHTKEINELAFTPDGERLLSTSADGTIRVWNVADGTQAQLIDYSNGATQGNALAIAPDGQHFAEGHHRLNLREFPSGRITWSQTGASIRVAECAFSSDGSRLATISFGEDPALTIYDRSGGRVNQTISGVAPADSGMPVDLRFLADDRLLLSVHDGWPRADGTKLLLWNVETGQVLQEIEDIGSADVSLDGHMVVTKGPGKLVRIWRLREAEMPTAGETPHADSKTGE